MRSVCRGEPQKFTCMYQPDKVSFMVVELRQEGRGFDQLSSPLPAIKMSGIFKEEK